MTKSQLKRLRSLLWLYLWLLILEGALRKWILPGLSNPLLLIRDPIALLALIWGWPLLKRPKWSQWINPLFFIGIAAFLLAIVLGHGDIPVAAYGSRILLLQLPLIFLYGAVFDQTDVIKFSWVIACLAIPMTILIVAQSNLPSTHVLNVAPGGEGTAVFDGTLDRFRPPGVFSFISGVASFYTLAASSLFTLLYGSALSIFGRLFTMVIGIALVVAQPVSMSRSLLAGYLQVVASLTGALALSRTKLLPIIAGFLAVAMAIGIGTTVPAFKDTTEAFNERWESAAANESEGDARLGGGVGVFQNRFLSGFTSPLANLDHLPFFGHGIGMGTNVGAQRLSGSMTFLIGEGAWEASLGEMGFPLGIAFVIWRIALGYWILRLAITQALVGNRLPMIWIGSSLIAVVNGQIAQPTGLGFIVFSAGITLAACNMPTPPRA